MRASVAFFTTSSRVACSFANLGGGLKAGSPAAWPEGACWAGGSYAGTRENEDDGEAAAAGVGAGDGAAALPPPLTCTRSYSERIVGFISVRYASVSCAARVAAIS